MQSHILEDLRFYLKLWEGEQEKEVMFFIGINEVSITRFFVGANAHDEKYKKVF